MDPGARTRLRLIEVAERLFAERGVHGVSLREIGAQAGQRNTAAARYHFGSKAGLVDAIFRHRMTPINASRVAMLDDLDRTGRGADLRSLAAAYLYPLSEALGDVRRPSWYLRFAVQAAYVAGTAPTDLGRDEWTRGMHVIESRVARVLRPLPAPLRVDRWHQFTGFGAHALADREMQIQYGATSPRSPRAVFVAGLVDTTVALVDAPVSAETSTELRAARRRHA